jgi:hypothetical protein
MKSGHPKHAAPPPHSPRHLVQATSPERPHSASSPTFPITSSSVVQLRRHSFIHYRRRRGHVEPSDHRKLHLVASLLDSIVLSHRTGGSPPPHTSPPHSCACLLVALPSCMLLPPRCPHHRPLYTSPTGPPRSYASLLIALPSCMLSPPRCPHRRPLYTIEFH